MDHIIEGIVVSTELAILGLTLRSYLKSKKSLHLLEDVPQLKLDDKLRTSLAQSGNVVPYASLRGNVKALSPPIHCFHVPEISAVIQKLSTKEHITTYSRSGFWIESKRLINSVVNSIPFCIHSPGSKLKVEVIDPLSAKVLDLEVVADRYEPVESSLLQYIWQFISGVRKQGVLTSEEVLKEGTLVTVVGAVVQKDDVVSIMPPADGAPFYITTMPIMTLMKRVQSDIYFNRWVAVGAGTLLAATCGWLIWKYFRHSLLKAFNDKSRKERRRKVRTGNEELPPDKLCVVCQNNPKEIILLPCGHVCLCEDCSDLIPMKCPVCQGTIHSRNAAYIS